MRRLSALAAALVIATIAGCGGSTTKDPYQLAYAAKNATAPDVQQVKIGLAVSGGSMPITIAPDAFKVTVASKTHQFRLQVNLPTAGLGISAAQLALVGITGDSITLDVLFDGTALYLDSPAAAKLLGLLMAQAGQTPPADLSGWLKLGTVADFAGLAGQLGALPSMVPAASEAPVTDGASLKAKLDPYGVTLTYVETASRNGVSANHLAVAIDLAKLAANPTVKDAGGSKLDSLSGMTGSVSIAGDLWLDASTSRVVEIDIHVTPAAGAAASAGSLPSGMPDKVDLTVLVGTPDAGTTLDAPATFTEVPLTPLLESLVKSFGKGLTP